LKRTKRILKINLYLLLPKYAGLLAWAYAVENENLQLSYPSTFGDGSIRGSRTCSAAFSLLLLVLGKYKLECG